MGMLVYASFRCFLVMLADIGSLGTLQRDEYKQGSSVDDEDENPEALSS